jgi:hypothetical protein
VVFCNVWMWFPWNGLNLVSEMAKKKDECVKNIGKQRLLQIHYLCAMLQMSAMKKCLIGLLTVLMIVGCDHTVQVTVFNNSEIDRKNETVELCLCQLEELNPSRIIVTDADGRTIPSQILYKGTNNPQSLIFQVTLKAGSVGEYLLKNGEQISSEATVQTYLDSSGSNAVIWGNKDVQFHSASIFKNGWICPVTSDSLRMFSSMDGVQLLDNGLLRTTFVLTSNSTLYNKEKLHVEYTVSLDAGSCLSKVNVRFAGAVSEIHLGAGFFNPDSIAGVSFQSSTRCISRNLHVSGNDFWGMILPAGWEEVRTSDRGRYASVHVKAGETFVFYVGKGSSIQRFATGSSWNSYLANTAKAVSQPLKIKLLK